MQMNKHWEFAKYDDFVEFAKAQTSGTMRHFYDEEYYIEDMGGECAREFFLKEGLPETKYTLKPLKIAGLRPRMNVLDVGCGRGEMVFLSARLGAKTYGIDYSSSAISIAEGMKEKRKEAWASNANFIVGDAKALPFGDNHFDVVFLLDVIEHVSGHESKLIFKEIRRVLKPGAKIIMHTTPNRLKTRYGYLFYMLYRTLFRGAPFVHPYVQNYKESKMKGGSHAHKLLLHINEQTIFSIMRGFREAGFTRVAVWYGKVFNPLRRFGHLGDVFEGVFAKIFHIFNEDLYAVGYK